MNPGGHIADQAAVSKTASRGLQSGAHPHHPYTHSPPHIHTLSHPYPPYPSYILVGGDEGCSGVGMGAREAMVLRWG